MKRNTILTLALAAMMLFAAVPVLAEEGIEGVAAMAANTNGLPTGTIFNGPVDVYDGIWVGSSKVGTLNTGDAVIVMQQDSGAGMTQVFSRVNRLAGWVPSGNVQVDSISPVFPGVVISQNVTLRESPSTGAKQLARPSNGDVLDILDEQNGWYTVRYWDKTKGPLEGYVRTNFVVRNPAFVTTTKATYVYAMPSRNSKMVGEIISGTQLVVIGEWNDYWVVNLRSASGFIHKNDIEYNQIGGNG